MRSIFIICLIGLFAFSCTEEPTKKSIQIQSASGECLYSLEGAKSDLQWTAFKTSSKVAVSGTFDEFSISSGLAKGSALDHLASGQFQIVVSSLNSNNPDRNQKIINFFFGKLLESVTLEGAVKSLEGNDTEGTAIVELFLNGMNKLVPLQYSIDGGSIALSGTIDVLDWNAGAGIEALNQACYELHKGEDGESKLWSVVDLKLNTFLSPNCN